MSRLAMLPRFFEYYRRAKTKYNIHSPFIFEFLEEVLEDKRNYYAFSDLELLRERLKSDHREIEVTDLGAGSHQLKGIKRKISAIANHSLTGPFFSQLLFKMAKWRKPKNMLEMGTSLGLSASYLSQGCQSAKLITLEGCPQIAAVANSIFEENESDIEIRIGSFSRNLGKAMSDLKPLEFVFVDGHHNQDSTLAYWERLQPYLSDDAILIFDDIHWSVGMERAWEKIIQTPGVIHSIDLFAMGIVHWQKNTVSEVTHCNLIPSSFKWWNWGFFA